MASKVGLCIVLAAVVAATLGMDTSRFPDGGGRGGFGGFGPAGFGRERLLIHEWGTFTSLQDEDGGAIGGINADDEPAPEFVHRIADFLVQGPEAVVPIFLKGAPRCHPDATMRLETPVVYFYPPRGTELPLTMDVEVTFPGGWLSEYYPEAEVEAPGVTDKKEFGPLTDETVGRLRWNNLEVGVEGDGPETDSEVWLAPRRVPAAMVRSKNGETERFLFYRGLGRVESPLAVSRDESGDRLVLTENFPGGGRGVGEVVVPRLWLVHIRQDKSCSFRELAGFRAACDGKAAAVTTTEAEFAESDFSSGNIDALSASMREALVADGLFPAEAKALLETWKASYFESAGLRLFYLLPRAWIDRALPLEASVDADVVRTMVGRVEIVTPNDRRMLEEIAAGPASDAKWMNPLSCGGASEPPADFAAYKDLGRFRNALVLDEVARRPTAALEEFIKNYRLEGYQPAEVEAAAAVDVADD